jgi:DNA-directed RNA polymerase specialized sigma24 family protein
MPFNTHALRYHPEESYPSLYAYLHRNAQRYLGVLKYDAFEVDTVIGHVVEQLVRLGLLGGKDHTLLTALDHLADAQFYAFLARSVRNKAIDRQRKRRLQVSTSAEWEAQEDIEGGNDPLNDAVESVWGGIPFATPEEITLQLASQQDLRNVLKHCILQLRVAPRQLQAVLQELQEIGVDDLFHSIVDELHLSIPSEPGPHMSQHRDHAHKKLRLCLQNRSSNLAVMIALRLTNYVKLSGGKLSTDSNTYVVDVQALAQQDLAINDVHKGLYVLVSEGLVTWHGEAVVQLSADQIKRLSRFYQE